MRLSLLAIAAGLLVAGNAAAGDSPQTANLSVTASVAKSCHVTTTALAFGAYDPADANNTAPKEAQGSVNVRCTKNVTATVALDDGQNQTASSNCTAPQRQMSDGSGQLLRYDIYQNEPRTTVWGCTAGTTTQSYSSPASTTTTNLIAYGRIPAGQDVAEGSFADTVAVTVTF